MVEKKVKFMSAGQIMTFCNTCQKLKSDVDVTDMANRNYIIDGKSLMGLLLCTWEWASTSLDLHTQARHAPTPQAMRSSMEIQQGIPFSSAYALMARSIGAGPQAKIASASRPFSRMCSECELRDVSG